MDNNRGRGLSRRSSTVFSAEYKRSWYNVGWAKHFDVRIAQRVIVLVSSRKPKLLKLSPRLSQGRPPYPGPYHPGFGSHRRGTTGHPQSDGAHPADSAAEVLPAPVSAGCPHRRPAGLHGHHWKRESPPQYWHMFWWIGTWSSEVPHHVTSNLWSCANTTSNQEETKLYKNPWWEILAQVREQPKGKRQQQYLDKLMSMS